MESMCTGGKEISRIQPANEEPNPRDIQNGENLTNQDQAQETLDDIIISDQTQETLLEKDDIISDHENPSIFPDQTQEMILSENSNIVSDQTQEHTLSEKMDFVLDQTQQVIFSENANVVPDRTQEIILSENANIVSDKIQETLWRKMDTLSTKIQMLKNEHAIVSDEVKRLMAGSLPGSRDLSDALRHLGTKYDSLKKCYLEEMSERKRLYNEVIELRGNIRVFCRCRPLSPEEIANGCSSIVDIDLSKETELQINLSDSSRKQFRFNHVFGPQHNQEAVFAQTSPIVTSVLDGFNVCIFAYGQTGTGKTFTMEGTAENRGVNFRTLEQLFRISKERNSNMKYELYVSMLEVYNEKIRDLLADHQQQSRKLEIKKGPEGMQDVPGLIEAQVYDTHEVWELLKTGERTRSVGSTNLNELSSRSHCLLRVTVKGESMVNGQRSRSHLWLVDLAGSERVGKTEVEGERLKESQYINKSLSALGDVISALASKNPHIPYRNSKLTHLLQSSLGGDCKTLMFVQISPSDSDLGETLCSLNFASRVRGIEHGPARKQADPIESFKYKQMAEKLRQDEKESKKMQDSLQLLQLKFAAREQLCRNLQEKVRDLENQLADERKLRLQRETKVSGKDQKEQTFEKKPPLIPSRLRAPLRRLTNIMPQVPHQISIAVPTSTTEEKENVSTTSNRPLSLMRARRVSLVSSARQPTMQQPRRRASIAVSHPEPSHFSTPLNSSSRYSRLHSDGATKISFLRDPQTSTRYSTLPEERVVAATPDSKINSRISGKFLSPPMQGSWKPKLPTVASPRQRRFISSPLNLRGLKNAQTLNKFCLSVQKKVGSSPTTQQQYHPAAFSEAFLSQSRQGKEVLGKLGSARRILCNNPRKRRVSIQSFM